MFFSVTDVGQKRETNQDYIYANAEATGMLPNLFIVADGMGGHNAGDFASRFAVEEFLRQIEKKNQKSIIRTLEESIAETNKLLYEQSQNREELSGMGTTFVVAVLSDDRLYVANVGDSRLYLYNDEKMHQITQDHSMVEEMIRRGEIAREDARFHPKKNVITRALGTQREITADYFEVPLKQDDVILMCSDGLTNMVEDEEIGSVIKKADGNLEKAGNELLRMANESGGKDNISIVLVCRGQEA